MSTITEGIVLTGADLDAAREFVDRAIINHAYWIGGDLCGWPTSEGLTVNVGNVLRILRLVTVRETLSITGPDGNHFPLRDEEVASMRDAAALALRMEPDGEPSDDWEAELARDADLARATLAALDAAGAAE